jgi:hypothetical protein
MTDKIEIAVPFTKCQCAVEAEEIFHVL